MRHVLFYFLVLLWSLNTSAQSLVFSTVSNAAIIEINQGVVAEAYRRLGIDIDIKRYPAARALIESNAGNVDGELYRIAGIEANYPDLVQVPTPISSIDWMVYSKDDRLVVNGWASLKDYFVAIERGVILAEERTKTLKRQMFNDNRQMMRMLELGRIDLAIDTRLDGLFVLQELGFSEITMREPPLERVFLYHYLHKKHQALVPKLDDVLQQIQREGLAEKIADQMLKRLNEH